MLAFHRSLASRTEWFGTSIPQEQAAGPGGAQIALARTCRLGLNLWSRIIDAKDFLFSLAVLAVATTITPGPSTLLAAASGIRHGLIGSLPLAVGVAVGLALLMAAGAFGLSALLRTAPSLQLAIKILGSLYLVWLAWRIFRSGTPKASEDASGGRAMGFTTGLAVLFLVPKAWMMALAAAGAYAEFTSNSLELALLLSLTFGCAGLGAMLLWCLGGALLGRMLKTDAQWFTVNLVLAIATVVSVATVWV